ncbi:MAG TPA: alpha/beta hydrolase [Acidimicrobiales bacterium]|nr:alpha/beta hydrolase [Acidimicrobiales bacterium]
MTCDHEATWLADAKALPPDHRIEPAGVTVEDFLAFHGRQPTPIGYRYDPYVVYGTAGAGGRPLHLHMYRPTEVDVPRAAVVFVHGGGWWSGNPFKYMRAAALLAARGYVTATVCYRLVPEATWPAALEDAKCAVRWVRAHADELGVDPDRIAVSGDSAGGHLAALVALTPGQFEGDGGHGDITSEVQLALLLYPLTDMHDPATPTDGRTLVSNFLGEVTETRLRESSPVNHVHPDAPPVLTITGSEDALTTVAMIGRFHAALDDAGVPNKLVVYPGRSHAFDFAPDDWNRWFDDMRTFLETYLPAVAR